MLPYGVTLEHASKTYDAPVKMFKQWIKKGILRSERTPDGTILVDYAAAGYLVAVHNGEHPYVESFKTPKGQETDFTHIELFAGAGGLALGFENAGLKTKLLVEKDKDAVATLRANLPDANIVHEDVRNMDYSIYRGKVDVVSGGFPCQSFSYSGQKAGFADKTRGTLFFEFARCIQEVQPKIILAENVRGLIQHDKGRTLATMIAFLNEFGYRVEYRLLRAQFLDVPQKRERLFIVGVRQDLETDLTFPYEKTSAPTLREYLNGCPPSQGVSYSASKKAIMEHVPEGGYWRDLPDDLQREYMKGSYFLSGGQTGMARRLRWDEPSLTLTCNPSQKQTERCHPSETRPLTIREYARIQTFPDSYTFKGSLSSQYRQIGNAVPVNMAYHMASEIVKMLCSLAYQKAEAAAIE